MSKKVAYPTWWLDIEWFPLTAKKTLRYYEPSQSASYWTRLYITTQETGHGHGIWYH